MPIVLNGSGPITGVTSLNTTVSDTEIGYLDGVTSALQTQINTAGGLVKITDSTFSASSAVNINNCFTSSYDNYRLILTFVGTNSSINFQSRLRVSGSDNTTSNYGLVYWDATTAFAGPSRSTAQTSWTHFSASDTGDYQYVVADILRPNLASRTMYAAHGFASIGGGFIRMGSGYFDATTVFDGISVYPAAGTISGTIRIYGYRN